MVGNGFVKEPSQRYRRCYVDKKRNAVELLQSWDTRIRRYPPVSARIRRYPPESARIRPIGAIRLLTVVGGLQFSCAKRTRTIRPVTESISCFSRVPSA